MFSAPMIETETDSEKVLILCDKPPTLWKLQSEMNAASPSCCFWRAWKANIQGLFSCLLSVYWTLLLFPCRHNNASGAKKSWNNRQSHFFHFGKCKWQQGKSKQTHKHTKHSFGKAVNNNNNNVYTWHLKASYSKKKKPPCTVNLSSFICAHVSTCVASGCGGKASEACMIEGWNGLC